MFRLIASDLRAKAAWVLRDASVTGMIKVLFTDGTPRCWVPRDAVGACLSPASPELFFNKVNVIFCGVIIGRGAEFGPALVFVHFSRGIVINGRVSADTMSIEHQVTIGPSAERRQPSAITSTSGRAPKCSPPSARTVAVGAKRSRKGCGPGILDGCGWLLLRPSEKGRGVQGPGADTIAWSDGTPTSDQE